MIRAIGAAAVVICCSALGFKKAAELRCRHNALRELESDFFDIKTMLEFNAATTGEILSELSKTSAGSFWGELDPTDLQGSLQDSESFRSVPLLPSEREAVVSAVSRLGTTDLQTQLAIAERARGAMQRAGEKSALECDEKCRLYSMLGFLGGVFVSLLII